MNYFSEIEAVDFEEEGLLLIATLVKPLHNLTVGNKYEIFIKTDFTATVVDITNLKESDSHEKYESLPKHVFNLIFTKNEA